jgi:hypothetical protein
VEKRGEKIWERDGKNLLISTDFKIRLEETLHVKTLNLASNKNISQVTRSNFTRNAFRICYSVDRYNHFCF